MQESNPYRAPSAELPESLGEYGSGRFSIGRAWSDALEATRSHVGEWLLGGLLCGVLYTVLLVSVLGAIVGLPVLVWGAFYWGLRMLRGQSSGIGELFEGFRRYGRVLGPSLLLMVLWFALSMLGPAVQIALSFTGIDILAGLGVVFSNAWSAVMFVRLGFAWFYLVDREMGAVDALRASWEATSSQWLNMLLLLLLAVPLYLVGFLALIVGLFVAVVIWMFMMASAYRQTAGDPLS